MDTSETAGAIRDLLLELDLKRRREAYRKAAREYWQWAAQIPREERAEQEALRHIYEQQRRGRGPLINCKKCPHRGWKWRTSSCRLRDGHHVAVEGWLPPIVVRRADWPHFWPPHDHSLVSLDVLLAALAVFHDLALPQVLPLMDYREKHAESPRSFLGYLRELFTYGADIRDTPGIDAWGLPIAQDYLAHAKARLRVEKGGKTGLPPAGSEAPPTLPSDAAPKAAPRTRKPNLAETFILAVFQGRPESETRKYLKAAAVYAAVKEKHPEYGRGRRTIARAYRPG